MPAHRCCRQTSRSNCRQTGFTSNYTTSGTNNPPFVYFTNADANATIGGNLISSDYRRNLGNIRHSAMLVMMGESSNNYWTSNTSSTVNGVVHYAPGLGARHGTRTANGSNAFTNLAFFDGHVDLLPTAPIDATAAPSYNAGTDGMSAATGASGAIFTLYNDHR